MVFNFSPFGSLSHAFRPQWDPLRLVILSIILVGCGEVRRPESVSSSLPLVGPSSSPSGSNPSPTPAPFIATSGSSSVVHSCVVIQDGSVRCWGYTYTGLGDGSTTISTAPVAVTGISNAIAVGAGGSVYGDTHTCAVEQGGGVKCWGSNYYGQLGNGSNTDSSIPVPVSGITNAAAVSLGELHSCALLNSGEVKCWGMGELGELGNNTSVSSNVPVTVQGITTATKIDAGSSHTCAVLANKTIKCWGWNQENALGAGSASSMSPVPLQVALITTAESISAGYRHSCAILTGGSIRCWGENNYGQLGTGSTTGSSGFVSGISNALQVINGTTHSCALLATGNVKCWGNNDVRQLGNENPSGSLAPSDAVASPNPSILFSGWNFNCAISTSGAVRCWGQNDLGQLGTDGTSTPSSSEPLLVPGF